MIYIASPGHNQNWIYSDVIELQKMAPTLRDVIPGHISALFSALKCLFPKQLWEPYLRIMKKAWSHGERKWRLKRISRSFIRETVKIGCVLGQESS